MKRLITLLAILATLAPATGFARDTSPGGPDREEGGADFDVSDYVLGRGDFERPPSTSAHQTPVSEMEDIISTACGDGEVLIIYNDDGTIDEWDCD